MTDDKIAEIRARHNAVLREKVHERYYSDAHNDRAALLAEVERLTRQRDEARAEAGRLHDDARRYRWLRDQPDLYLVTDGTRWYNQDGSDFRVSHQLSTGDSRMGVYETLDETVDQAMTLEAKP